uniref:UDP-N-acetylmuramoyl-tripeptide--D-alanyl-D-alanine ligase n=1 Tax=Dictyoglomus thermophilum TaxID=14 RepID=A0A7C3RMK4_DICTH
MKINLTVEEMLKATKGILIKGNLKDVVNSVSIDSRTIKPEDLFIPLKGEKFDGHDFINDAIRKGAKGFIFSRDLEIPVEEVIVIKVKDTLIALQNLANYYRKKIKAKVIGVTGSSGKTTTKNLIGELLSKIGKVNISRENYNNEIGVSLTILETEIDTNFLVLEMAMRGKGQIRELSKIAEPDVGIITNIGWAHIGILGSREAIMEAKAEIFDYINDQGYAILNRDDDLSMRIFENLKLNKYTFGFSEDSNIRGKILDKLDDKVRMSIGFPDKSEIEILLHLYPLNIYRNVLSAFGVLWIFSPKSVNNFSFVNYDLSLPKQRLNTKITYKGIKIIDDTYNANPDSVKTAIEYLDILPSSGRKVLLLGDMLELGEYSISAHKEVIKHAIDKDFYYLLFYGEEFSKAIDDMKAELKDIFDSKIFYTKDEREIKGFLRKILRPYDIILIKGSRAMKMENFVKFIEEEI